MPLNYRCKIKGTYFPPGDKSISHRILILAGQAIGMSEISNLLEGEDVLNTLKAMRVLGAQIKKKTQKIFCFWYTTGGIISTKSKYRFWKFRNRYKVNIGINFLK